MASKNSSIFRFLKKVAIGAIPLYFVIFGVIYYAIAIKPSLTGDLGKLGKITFDPDYTNREYFDSLPSPMTRWYEHGDSVAGIISIGDSFNTLPNRNHTTYLAHLLGDTITTMVVNRMDASPEQLVFDLLNSGFFEENTSVDYLILEGVEREFINRWLEIDPDRKVERPSLLLPPNNDEPEQTEKFSLASLYSQGIDWMKISLGLDKSPVKSARLSRDCFTIPGRESELDFYFLDLYQTTTNDRDLRAVAANIRLAQQRLAQHNVKLICFVAPDKYEVYQHLIVDNPYPEKLVGHQLEALDSLDCFFTPLPQLRKAVDSGMKDVYIASDTHWSRRTASLVANLLYRRIIQSPLSKDSDEAE